MGSGDRQRRGGRNEQQRGHQCTGENGGGLTSGNERSEHCHNPFCVTNPTIGSALRTLQGPCQIGKVVVFQWRQRSIDRASPHFALLIGEKSHLAASNRSRNLSENGHALQM